jgi:hypothetical protein
MRLFLVIALLVMVAIFAGWLTFAKYGDTATITIDGAEFQKDTRETIDSAKELINKAQHDPAKDPPTEVQPPPHVQPRTTSQPPKEVLR